MAQASNNAMSGSNGKVQYGASPADVAHLTKWKRKESNKLADYVSSDTGGATRREAGPDDEEISFTELGVDYSKTKITKVEPKKLDRHILVFEKWSDRGCWSCDLEEEFDKDMLDLSATAFTLPTGDVAHVVEPYYEDHDFDYGDSWTEDSSTYIVTKDGNVIELDRA